MKPEGIEGLKTLSLGLQITADMIKVLEVDDNPLSMELVIEILTMHGFTVHSAIDGEEAIKKIEKEVYDLILMDIELPGIDGIEVTKIIKAKYKNIPVIALTSYAMKGDKERFINAGFDDYVSKPLDISDFIKKIEKYTKVNWKNVQLPEKEAMIGS